MPNGGDNRFALLVAVTTAENGGDNRVALLVAVTTAEKIQKMAKNAKSN